MFKGFLTLLFLCLLLFSCSKKDKSGIISQPTEEEITLAVYEDAVEALKSGDSYYAGKKFKEVESLMPQTEWAAKAALMEGYAHYSRNAYSKSVFSLERYIKKYPSDVNVQYSHYLIAICFFEQILDKKKDLQPLLKTKKKLEFIILNYPESDYAIDSRFKMDLIIDQLAAKEMSIARYYMKTSKWIPAINRLKIVVDEYDRTVFIEEALYRLVEVYYKIGLEGEAKQAAAILGYNYQSSQWYKRSYKIFNKKYKPQNIKKRKKDGLIRRAINKLF